MSTGVMGSAAVRLPMSVSGLCTICEAAQARHACDGCGALVCDDHYDAEPGLCVNCARPGGRRL